MNTPNIRFYAKLEYSTDSKQTPKYVITAQAGFYPPMEQLRGRNGKVSFYLMEKLKEGASVPAMRLQAKGSLNLTGLKDFFVGGRLSGFAYGYPLKDKTFSSKAKPNPFYEYKDDGFLFIVHQDEAAQREAERVRPSYIEMIVLEGAKVLISSYCKQLMMGGFDEELKSLRAQAKQADAL